MNYLEQIKKQKIQPNFWCSKEYLKLADCTERTITVGNNIFSGIDKNGQLLFPLIDYFGKISVPLIVCKNNSIWSDFDPKKVEQRMNGMEKHFLDWEYLFDPWQFSKKSGSKWENMRKSLSRIEKRLEGRSVEYRPISNVLNSAFYIPPMDINNAVLSWLHDMPKEIILNKKIMWEYVLNGKNRAGLFIDGQLAGINIWDHSWEFINFRYSLCFPMAGLCKYLRLKFYQFEAVRSCGKLVNEGGMLDNAGFKFFKDIKNPIRVRKVYSWKTKKEIESES